MSNRHKQYKSLLAILIAVSLLITMSAGTPFVLANDIEGEDGGTNTSDNDGDAVTLNATDEEEDTAVDRIIEVTDNEDLNDSEGEADNTNTPNDEYAVIFCVTDEEGVVVDPTIEVRDGEGQAVAARQDGGYQLEAGTYTYSVFKEGFQDTTGSFEVTDADKNVYVTLAAEVIEPDTYTVTFKDWDGTELRVETVEPGEDATAPADPIREGYTFTSWDTDFINVTQDLTVTAQYIALNYTLTINYADKDGNALADSYVDEYMNIGDSYDVESPIIDSYELADSDRKSVSGVMQAKDAVVTVVYNAIGDTMDHLEPEEALLKMALTAKHILIFDDGQEELMETAVVEDLDLGTIIRGYDFKNDYDSIEYLYSIPEELVLSEEENSISLFYKLDKEAIDDFGENPDGLEQPTEISAPVLYYPSYKKTLSSVLGTRTAIKGLSLTSYPGDHDNIEPPAPGSLALSKTATPVEGTTNQWKVTLTLTGKDLPTTSDIVLVIDTSGSMGGWSGRMQAAKNAATQFVNSLLDDPDDTSTRIALVSFASGVTVHQEFQDATGKQALLAAINGLSADGGTFTQAGIKQAKILLDDSEAVHKNIVLLSDGEPTYSYAIKDISSNLNDTYFVKSGNRWYTRDNLAESVYNSSSVAGDGTSMTTRISRSSYYYHHGHSAIAESTFAKDSDITVYSVGLSAGTSGQNILDRVASPGKSYEATNDDLTAIFQTIAGSISFAATDATVTDPVGDMFSIPGITGENYEQKITVSSGTSVSYNTETKTIHWSVPFVSETNPATMTYIVEIDSSAESGVVYPTNKETYVDYTNAIGVSAERHFDPIPKVGINAGTIVVYYYRVNSEGIPVNSQGVPVGNRQEAELQHVTYKEGTNLQLNVPYDVYFYGDDASVISIDIGGKTYNYHTGSTEWPGATNPTTVTLTTAQPSGEVWYACEEVTDVTVTFNDNYLGAPDPYDVVTAKGTSLGTHMPTDPTRESYIFIGWNTAADGNGDVFNENTVVTADITVYAQWIQRIKLILHANSGTATYDGTMKTVTGFTSTGLLEGHTVTEVIAFGSGTDVGNYDVTFSGNPVIMSGSSDVTYMYNINYVSGTLTVNLKALTITADDAEKEYDGTALTKNSYTHSDLAEGDTITGVTVTGSQTDVGSSANVASNAVIKSGEVDVTANYDISYIDGTLEVTAATGEDLDITDYSGVYDGDAHSITVNNEITGDTVYYSLTNNGIDWTTTKPMFTDVTAAITVYVKVTNLNYNDRTGSGTVTITARPIEITAASATKRYDGKVLTNSNWSLTGGTLAEGDKIENVTVKGSQTSVGSSANVPSAAVIMCGEENVTNSYNITYIDGKLTITRRPSSSNDKPIIVPPTEIPLGPALEKDVHFAYIIGYPDNTVRPQNNITREEVSAVFYRLLEANYRDSIKTIISDFPDVAQDRWSSYHIGTLANGNIIVGYPDGTFKPGDYITRAEVAVIASKFDKLTPIKSDKFSDVSGHWAEEYIYSAAHKGWVTGYPDGTFKPDQYITRAEFATLVNNVLERRVKAEDVLPEARQFSDLKKDAWHYEAMQEAINSHNYTRKDDGYEEWADIYYPDLDM